MTGETVLCNFPVTPAPTPNPMDPPPQDPSTGAKGSALLRLARRVIFAAQPRAGAEAARREEDDDDEPIEI